MKLMIVGEGAIVTHLSHSLYVALRRFIFHLPLHTRWGQIGCRIFSPTSESVKLFGSRSKFINLYFLSQILVKTVRKAHESFSGFASLIYMIDTNNSFIVVLISRFIILNSH